MRFFTIFFFRFTELTKKLYIPSLTGRFFIISYLRHLTISKCFRCIQNIKLLLNFIPQFPIILIRIASLLKWSYIWCIPTLSLRFLNSLPLAVPLRQYCWSSSWSCSCPVEEALQMQSLILGVVSTQIILEIRLSEVVE